MSGIYKAVKQGTTNIVKIFKGSQLIWEANGVKTITFNLPARVSAYSSEIQITKDSYEKLTGKSILEVKIGDYPSIDGQNIKGTSNAYGDYLLTFNKNLSSMLNSSAWIEAGTKVTITYE